MRLKPLPPARVTLAALLHLAWALTFGALRDFVWADLREGLLDLRGFSHATRLLVWLGFALLFALTGALLFHDLWRATFDLLPMLGGTPGRGSLIPVALIPVSLFMFTFAWSFALTGALHAHVVVRLGVLVLYITAIALWNRASLVSTQAGSEFLITWLPVVGVLVLFALRWRRPSRPPLDMLLLLTLVAASLIHVQDRLVSLWRATGTALFLGILDSNIVLLSTIALPFLLLLGLDIADFVQSAGGWIAEVVAVNLGRWGLAAGVLVVFAVQWRTGLETLQSQLTGTPPVDLLLGYVGALVAPVMVLLLWFAIKRQALPPSTKSVGAAAQRSAPWFILAFWLLNLSSALLANVAAAAALDTSALWNGGRLFDFEPIDILRIVAIGALTLAAVAAWRGNTSLAYTLGVQGAVVLWSVLTAPGQPLDILGWQGPEVRFWWVAIFTAFALIWFVRRQLSAERLARLLAVLTMSWLLLRTDFIENPLNPLFGFTGVGLIAFGVVWDAATIGAWANRETGQLPRPSRVFLYLGYALFSVTIVNWFLASHNLDSVAAFTGDAATQGLKLVGLPLIYALYVAILAQPYAVVSEPSAHDQR